MQISRRWRWGAVVAWMGVIFGMSARSDSGNQSGWLTRQLFSTLGWSGTPDMMAHWEHYLRKTAHFSEYALLATLLAFALEARAPRLLLTAWLLATAYAATDEVHQIFVPNRGPSLWDVGIDSSGAATAILLITLFLRLRRR